VDVAEILGSDFPDLAVDSVERIGEGWDHVAYVDRDLVFACGYLNALSDLGELLDDDEADDDDIEWCVSFLNDWS
jgi:hypothetical protein